MSDHRQRIKHSADKAETYLHRKESKHRAEMNLIRRTLPYLTETRTILDAPCGVGRATIMLSRMGYALTAADLGEGALAVARREVTKAGVNVAIDKEDLCCLSYADRGFDAVLCFRFFHHLPTPEHRDEIVRELCRVADRYVLISYLSPWSPTSAKRLLKKALGVGQQSVQNITPLSEVESYFARHGFSLVKDVAQTNLIHSLHLAVFSRIG